MRTIISGSRTITDAGLLYRVMERCPWEPTTILSGGARGVDKLGEEWAREWGIPLEVYPANWEKYGKTAGFIRNSQMASKARALVAIKTGVSNGTKNMIKHAVEHGLHIYVFAV